MAKASIFQHFVHAAWTRIRRDYPFVSRFEKAFCPAIPKSSSFYVGRAPLNGKHFIFDFQHNPKSWNAGQFTINVHISTELVPTDNFRALSGYEVAEDGYYRLASSCIGYDKWWCLRDRDRSLDSEMREMLPHFDPDAEDREYFAGKWRPSSFEDTDTVIREALDDVFQLLDQHLFQRFGFAQVSQSLKTGVTGDNDA